jgi:hypothetical protein
MKRFGRLQMKIASVVALTLLVVGFQNCTNGLAPVQQAPVAAAAAAAASMPALGCSTTGSCTQLTLQSPQDYQVYQRDSSNSSNISIAASLTSNSPFVRVVATDANGNILADTQLSPNTQGTNFSTSLKMSAGGWYKIWIQQLSNSTTVVAEGVINHVGIGEVFLTAGQSNSTWSGEVLQTNSALVSGAELSGPNTATLAWRSQIDAGKTYGSLWPNFANLLAAQLNMPVGIIEIGCGSTSLLHWVPSDIPGAISDPTLTCGTDAQTAGGLFNRLVNATKDLGTFRALLWHQGEGDIWTSAQDYHDRLKLIMVRLNATTPLPVPWFVANGSYTANSQEVDMTPASATDPTFSCNLTGKPMYWEADMVNVRKGQQMLWEDGSAYPGPDTDGLIGSTFRYGNDGRLDGACVHMNDTGLKTHGMLWYRVVSDSGIVPGSATVSGRSLTSVYMYYTTPAIAPSSLAPTFTPAPTTPPDYYFLTSAQTIANYTFSGLVFSLANQKPANGAPLMECTTANQLHFLSEQADCEGYTVAAQLGYMSEQASDLQTLPLYLFTDTNGDSYLTTTNLDAGFSQGLVLGGLLGFVYNPNQK